MTAEFLKHDDITKACSMCGKYTPASDPDNEIVHYGLDPDQWYVHCGTCVRELKSITKNKRGIGEKATFMAIHGTPYSVLITRNFKNITITCAHPMLHVTPENFRDAIAYVLEKMKEKK
jgi:hypothetical protein